MNTDKLLLEKQYFDGAIYRQYEKVLPQGNTKYHVIEIDSSKAEFFVSPLSRKYVPFYLTTYGLDIAINGDGFNATNIVGFAVSDGQPYGKMDVEQTLYFSKENVITHVRANPLANAISYPNLLVENGAIVKINKDPSDIRGRSALGYTKDQKTLFILAVDGKDYYSHDGMNFPETAQVLVDLGCDYGVMLDGGGSTTLAIMENNNPVVLNVPSGEDFVAGYTYPMRRVANVFGVRMKSHDVVVEQPPTQTNQGDKMNYKVIKSARFRSAPTMKTNDTGASSTVGEMFDSNVTQIDSNNNSITMVQHPNMKWLPLSIDGIVYTEAQAVVLPPTPPVISDEISYVTVHFKDINKPSEDFYPQPK